MEKEIIKEYPLENLTIIWKPEKCIHSGICVKKLPRVYNPREKPWIKQHNASEQELIAQIDECPSGALTYRIKGEIETNKNNIPMTTVKCKPNGPLLVEGKLVITDNEGVEHVKENITAFCRCGASNNKPFCDGTHNKVGWKDS
ncbi:(4Fe-4S)-binding protein [Maribacter arenosus]|uniref:(4Fe-4S)-binding protein n=1 Tax=Maribacter arenosus TaxID=1854708 RepID=A0ABR7V8Z4_9FLAO|nr:(4Fe-4S)-binding protein [Maribacter arenosus]MBD0849346.1 (4Fe-4S)-binding protein [Maribacter arenosus]